MTKSTLRESIDCLNFKFDENSIQSSNNSSLTNFFRLNLNDLNKEFYKFDSEFSATNWADLQTNEVLIKFFINFIIVIGLAINVVRFSSADAFWCFLDVFSCLLTSADNKKCVA
jgi:hypothetical protein